MKRVLGNCCLVYMKAFGNLNGLELGFVQHWLNPVYITGPYKVSKLSYLCEIYLCSVLTFLGAHYGHFETAKVYRRY